MPMNVAIPASMPRICPEVIMNPQKKLGIALMVHTIDQRQIVFLRDSRGAGIGSSGSIASVEVSTVGAYGFN